MSSENVTSKRLQELSGSDYEIADGQPDIRGWDVKDESGKNFGEVKELLFDEISRKVRYIILDLDDNDFGLESRKVLVPIGIATLHESDDDVILPGVTVAQLQSVPAYEKDSLTAANEDSIRNAFLGVGAAGLSETVFTLDPGMSRDNFYNHDHFNEDNLYRTRSAWTNPDTTPAIQEELGSGKQEIESSRIRLRSGIIESPVTDNIIIKDSVGNIETDVEKVGKDGTISNDATGF